jgi:hypothetical protein
VRSYLHLQDKPRALHDLQQQQQHNNNSLCLLPSANKPPFARSRVFGPAPLPSLEAHPRSNAALKCPGDDQDSSCSDRPRNLPDNTAARPTIHQTQPASQLPSSSLPRRPALLSSRRPHSSCFILIPSAGASASKGLLPARSHAPLPRQPASTKY